MIYKTRQTMAQVFKSELGNRFYFRQNLDWINEYSKAKFVCAPRGFGRNSFRLFEALQAGLVPIIIYNDIPWIPYYGAINWDKMAIITSIDKISSIIPRIKNTTPEEIKQMRLEVAAHYHTHFTRKAVMNHVMRFLKGGFEASDLRCGVRKYTTGEITMRYKWT